MGCHGNQIFCSCRYIAFRTISLPDYNGLCCKLTEIALFIYLIYFPGILCVKPKNSRGKNLIIVAL